jgi:hypothetical protein
MRIIPALFLAGFGSLALAGAASANSMTVRLPDGTVETIDYSGDVAPQVSFGPPPGATAMPFRGTTPDPVFAQMQQISDRMDRDMARFFDAAMRGGPLAAVDIDNLPAGVHSYSIVQTLTPNGVCTQSTEIVGGDQKARPQKISHVTGACGGAANNAAPATTPADVAPPLPPHRRDLLQAKAAPGSDGLRMANWQTER